MKRYRIGVCSLAVASVLLVGGCSKSDSSSAVTTTAAANGGLKTSPATADVTTVNLVVGDTKGVDGPMTMTVGSASAPAGKVRFVAKNSGTIVHEVIVLKTDTPVGKMEMNADGKVSESASVGEIAEFGAGTNSSVTLDLKSGNYVLVCNVKDHYMMGMRAPFKVT